ncbi:hypothetical protein SY83_11600 [Paenibacillus swuensis]|uniref:KinB signaling pathway activation protein n=1 Tax=Paenibacillus swuensis TaxID=1178515 RepID=A0A172TID3_9BACL|nr:KinB-signaling pathway activation protein [Paenibacillus swuensis]ANE46819.1 hypothetical protein SY83_11600 [Paenibacillus swuensis]
MNLKKWFYLFWTTLLTGGISAVIIGMVLRFTDKDIAVAGLGDISFNFLTMFLGGLMFGAVSQMAFFAYLTVNYIFKGVFRSYWTLVQVGIIIITLFEAAYLRILYDQSGDEILSAVTVSVLVLLGALAVTLWKVRLTNKSAFIPTLLWMTAGTILASIPGLQQHTAVAILFTLVPIFCCNAWQILQLHRILNTPKS